MLFERTAISKKPEELAKQELAQLKEEDQLSPNLVFRDHCVLDFLGLNDTYSEKDLEAAILSELKKFIWFDSVCLGQRRTNRIASVGQSQYQSSRIHHAVLIQGATGQKVS